jgi:ribosomal protein L37AE/L43A
MVCVCYKQVAVIEFLVTDKDSVSSINRRLCNVCESAADERSTVGLWAIRVTACKTGKAELCHLPSSGVLSQQLVFQCEGVMMQSVGRIHTLQPDKRRLALQSTKEVLFASFEVLDIPWCVRDSLLGASK